MAASMPGEDSQTNRSEEGLQKHMENTHLDVGDETLHQDLTSETTDSLDEVTKRVAELTHSMRAVAKAREQKLAEAEKDKAQLAVWNSELADLQRRQRSLQQEKVQRDLKDVHREITAVKQKIDEAGEDRDFLLVYNTQLAELLKKENQIRQESAELSKSRFGTGFSTSGFGSNTGLGARANFGGGFGSGSAFGSKGADFEHGLGGKGQAGSLFGKKKKQTDEAKEADERPADKEEGTGLGSSRPGSRFGLGNQGLSGGSALCSKSASVFGQSGQTGALFGKKQQAAGAGDADGEGARSDPKKAGGFGFGQKKAAAEERLAADKADSASGTETRSSVDASKGAAVGAEQASVSTVNGSEEEREMSWCLLREQS